MPLALTLDSIDALDDAIKPLYAAKDGKFHLDVEGLEDTTGLKSALNAERKTAREAAAASAAWKALGKTPDEIKELLEAQTKADEEKATKAGEWDKLRAQMNEKHAADLKAKDDATGKMRTALERYLIDAAAVTEIAKAKGVPELLLPHVQRQMKVIEDDNGDFIAQVVDSKGDPRVDGKGQPMTITALIEEMKKNEVYGRAFEADASGGGKAPGSGGGSGGGKVLKQSELLKLTPKERSDHFAKGGTVVAD